MSGRWQLFSSVATLLLGTFWAIALMVGYVQRDAYLMALAGVWLIVLEVWDTRIKLGRNS